MMMSSSSSFVPFVVASRNKKPREKRERKRKTTQKNGVDLETLNYCETPNETENESLNIRLSLLCLVFFFVSSLFSFDF